MSQIWVILRIKMLPINNGIILQIHLVLNFKKRFIIKFINMLPH